NESKFSVRSSNMVKGWDSVQNRKACGRFLDGSMWKQICNNTYYNQVLTRYRGTLVKKGEPYTVFKSDLRQRVDLMVFFLIDEMRECSFVKVTSMNKFQCMNSAFKMKDIKTNKSLLACLPYRLRLAEELFLRCGSGSNYMFNENSSTILYYANVAKRLSELHSGKYNREQEINDSDGELATDKASLYSTSMIIVILTALLVIFVVCRWT
ncbi:hypothetical protein KR026_010300, partial [Drosophila bipectinata]